MNLSKFTSENLFVAATDLFAQLGITLNSNTAQSLSARSLLGEHFKENPTFQSIAETYYIGTIDDSIFEATGLFDPNYTIHQAREQADRHYHGLMLFALALDKAPTRTEISILTRAFNRISQKMPVALLVNYRSIPASGAADSKDNVGCISLALSERFKYKQEWRQGEKAGKVIILKDIQTHNTHTGHLKILQDLVKPAGIASYAQLHAHWLLVLDVNILNKKFYKELASWYFWALDVVEFPDDLEKNTEVRNATNLIRLITRIIFIWFIKEKSLVPNSLFDPVFLRKILKNFKNSSSTGYYKAILQNLFFGTLNQKMTERDFSDDSGKFNKPDQGIKTKYRYPKLFSINKDEVKKLFADVPFLNGGLFDCLDRYDPVKLEKGIRDQLFVDGFTRRTNKQPVVPDFIFFSEQIEVDHNRIYGTRNKRFKTQGLINILNNYKFTVAENTPLEEEIALDPELLGKVFENLLASYNPETQSTARKQTGSFYTPREIVNYMVDESLLEYLKQNCKSERTEFETQLRQLFSYSVNENPFGETETRNLVEAINNCKILDPACGSGAFPMGILQRMVHILQKLDPDNELWKEQQREKIIGDQIRQLEKDKKAIQGLSDRQVREKAIQAVEERLDELEEIFNRNYNFDDYSRKLYLIENCIYGIDIQPIAVQIAKLRFFISLVIDQKVNKDKANYGIRSLPNLETKFVAANTLIGLEIPTANLFSESNPVKAYEEQLKEVRHEYFTAKTREDKLRLQKQDKGLRKKIAKELEDALINKKEEEFQNIKSQLNEASEKLSMIESQPKQVETISTTTIFGETETKTVDKKKEKVKSQNSIIKTLEKQLAIFTNADNKDSVEKTAQKIATFDPYDQSQSSGWFDPEWMFGLSAGFDVVIGNPPYIQMQKDGGKLADELLDKGFETFERTGDIYSLFYEKGVQLIKDDGNLCYITSNKWMRAGYGKSTRGFFLKHNPLKLIDLGAGIFETATVDTNILLIQKTKKKTQPIAVEALDLSKEKDNINFENYKKRWVLLNSLTDASWSISNPVEQRIKQKIEAKGKQLKDFEIKINFGIKTGFNEAFIIDGKKKDELIAEDPKSAEIIKPILRGRDTKRYNAEFSDTWLIYVPWHFPLQNNPEIKGASLVAEKEFEKQFPAIYKHLLGHKKKLSARNKAETGIRYEWYALQRWAADYHQDFQKEKIVWKRIGSVIRFQYDDLGSMCLDSTCILTGQNIKFLLAYLNSKVAIRELLENSPKTGTGDVITSVQALEPLFVPCANEAEKLLIVKLVDKILTAKQSNPHADTTALEQQIDNLVYRLYDLTYAEVKVIDPEFGLSEEEYERIKVEE